MSSKGVTRLWALVASCGEGLLCCPSEVKIWDRVEQAADLSAPAWRLVAHSHLRTLGFTGLALVTTTAERAGVTAPTSRASRWPPLPE